MKTMIDRSKAPVLHPFGTLAMPAERVMRVGENTWLHTLQNGHLDLSSLHIVSAFDRAGSLPSERSAHSIYHKLSRGTADMDAAEVAEILDLNGSMISARAMGLYSSLSFLLLNTSIENLTDLICHVFACPVFNDSEFEANKIRMAQNYELEQRNCARVASRAMNRLLFGKRHPYAFPVTAEDYLSVTPEMIDAIHQQETMNHPLHIFLAGNIKGQPIEHVKKLAERLDSHLSQVTPIHPAVPMSAEQQLRTHVEMPESMQTAFSIGLPLHIDRAHPDYVDLRFAVMALGGYFGSRLMTNIREERGLCYGIGASLLCEPEGTRMVISAQCNTDHAEEAIDAVKQELVRLCNESMDMQELERLRGYAFSQLATQLDTPMAIQDFHISQLTLGIPADYYATQSNCLAALTPERIREVAEKYLNINDLRIATAGPSVQNNCI